MAEHTPKHEPSATDQPQPTAPELRERVKAHIKALIKRMKARLLQSP